MFERLKTFIYYNLTIFFEILNIFNLSPIAMKSAVIAKNT